MYMKIAVGNVLKNKKRSILIGMSLFISCSFLLISNSLANGAAKQYVEKLRNVQAGDVVVVWGNVKEIDLSDGGRLLFSEFDIQKDEENKKAIERFKSFTEQNAYEVESIFTPQRVFGILDTGRYIAYSLIYGLSEAEMRHLEKTKSFELEAGESIWDYDDYTVCISRATAEENSINIGDWIILDCTTPYGLVNSMEFAVVGIYRNGAPWENMYVYITDKNARELAEWDTDYFGSARIYLKDPKKADEFAARLDGYLTAGSGVLRSESGEYASQFFAGIGNLQKSFFTFFVLFLLFVIAVGIRATLKMSLFDRMAEFGTLRAIGFNRIQVFTIVFFEILVLALISLAAAFVLSSTLILILGRTGIHVGSGPAGYFIGGEHVYPVLMVSDSLIALMIMVLFSLLASLGPGLKLCCQKITNLLTKNQKSVFIVRCVFKSLSAPNRGGRTEAKR
jgi:ABC-type lipoprotein release transport system permease subunit